MDAGRRRFLAAGTAIAAAGLRGPLALGQQAPPAATGDIPLDLVAANAAGAALSYDGTAAGPVLRIAKDAALAVTLVNRLAEPTSLQWHGLRAGNAVDGDVPLIGQTLAPGAKLTMRVVPPDSGLFWFHPAALPGLPDQTARGLRGVVIVEDTDTPRVDSDIALTVDLAASPALPVVNGAAAPLRGTIVAGGRLRLRLLNASTARIMMVAIDGARPKIIAIDGQPSDLFEPVRDAVPVGPGARFEFLMDAPRAADAAVTLALRGAAPGDGAATSDALLMVLTTTGAPRDPLPPIAALPHNPRLPAAIPLERSIRADCVIEQVASGAARWRVNGSAGLDLSPSPLLTVPRGGAVTLGLDNRSRAPVPLRLHGHVMRLLHAKDDGWEPYWRDSVIVPPGSVSHVAFVADNPGRWLLESALFDQAAFGLRSWFVVA